MRHAHGRGENLAAFNSQGTMARTRNVGPIPVASGIQDVRWGSFSPDIDGDSQSSIVAIPPYW